MMLDAQLREQLESYLKLLESDISIELSAGDDQGSKDMRALLDELREVSTSDFSITVEEKVLERTPSFALRRNGETSRIAFAGVPLGHEFSSLVLALLQVSGRAPKVDRQLLDRIRMIKEPLNFETYVSLSCHNCPEVVQALNVMAVVNPLITHTMIDGAVFSEEVESKDIMGVPAIFLNGAFFGGGRLTLDEILQKLGQTVDKEELDAKEPFDVLVVGGGAAGSSAAIYAARKGIRTGIVAERFGGQVLDTLGIENFIGTLYTEGPKIASDLEAHVKHYGVDVMNGQRVKALREGETLEVELENGSVLKSKSVIIATGAKWRDIGVPGEIEFRNKGVAYCPHCDGPLFKGKRVAVVGGGNSGVEAAIDLAGIVKHVTVLEFLPELKADAVLQQRLYSLPNVTVIKNVQTKAITGSGKVEGISFALRNSGVEEHLPLEGVFVQIGLVASTGWLEGTLERNRMGEIIVDERGATSLPGVFAAGDCTTAPYKQIIIAMGSGATAALSAFDYLIRK